MATAVLLLLQCCTGNNQPAETSTDGGDTTERSFFPVTSFIKGQLLVLDSIPITPLLLTTVNGKTDSSWIAKNKLDTVLDPFLHPEITATNLTSFFKETKFSDQTINAVTFTYDPIGLLPDSIKLRHWDVYIQPETGNVEKVYIVKTTADKQQNLTIQLTWQVNKSAKITTILNKPDGTMQLLKEELLLWDF